MLVCVDTQRRFAMGNGVSKVYKYNVYSPQTMTKILISAYVEPMLSIHCLIKRLNVVFFIEQCHVSFNSF